MRSDVIDDADFPMDDETIDEPAPLTRILRERITPAPGRRLTRRDIEKHQELKWLKRQLADFDEWSAEGDEALTSL